MLIHRHDAAFSPDEWRTFLADHDFGELIASGHGRDVPMIVPTHFIYDGDTTVRLHLARPNPVWDALAENPLAVVSVYGDYTYIPTGWNANAGTPPEHGIPTSYYAAVQAIVRCRIVDEQTELAAILTAQLEHFQPEGGHAPVIAGAAPYGPQLAGIRGLVCEIEDVRAKFKYGGNKSVEHRERIADRLAGRDGPGDAAVRAQIARRITAPDHRSAGGRPADPPAAAGPGDQNR